MKIGQLFLLFAALVFWQKSSAQLSPGDLTKHHAALEGMFNCTKCHEVGEKVSDQKCLACHKEIKTRMDGNRGFHASKEVKSKNCAQCHSDHHGRNFHIIRLDEKSFDHNLAGFELTGKHKTIDCRACHKPDLVLDDRDLFNKDRTFMGVKTDCASCHSDPHQKTLGQKCADCHTTEGFEKATKFNHDKSSFPLAGKHKNVDCIECHKKETRNGAEFQKFADVPFANCTDCHKDPHKNQLGNQCKECHSEQGFEVFKGMGRFNHAKTDFPLIGKHKTVNCADCHQLDRPAETVFQDRKGVGTKDCATCHKDVHEGKFGPNCNACHNENSFKIAGVPANFDHNKTDFALKGKHVEVNCKKCHEEDFLKPLPFENCASCHSDFHEGQFLANGNKPDCAKCHAVEGFSPSNFGISEHAKTKFPLDGGHSATPCFSCHQKTPDKKWAFRGIGERCVDCHSDVHKGALDEKYYPKQACENCHVTASWADSKFDHGLTDFKLEGGHAKRNCAACHRKAESDGKGRFSNMATDCKSCHEDEHGGQFDKKWGSDCRKCHGFEDWKAAKFDHNLTAFKLEGKHAEVECSGCHKAKLMDGVKVVQYKFESFECIVCHK